MPKRQSTNFDMDYLIDEGKLARKLFFEDSRSKKLVARSAVSSVTRRRDIYSKKYIKSHMGGIKLMSLYDTIMPFVEFQKLDKETKLKYLQGWEENGFSRQDIADAWGKKVQAVHDLNYRLRRELEKSTETTRRTRGRRRSVANQLNTEQFIKPVEQMSPFMIQKIGEFTGTDLEKWIKKVIELIDSSSILKIYIGVQKISKGTTKLNFNLELSEELSFDQFETELKNLFSMLNNNDTYTASIEIKELGKKSNSVTEAAI